MIDILFANYHRDEFTTASLAAIAANTPAGEYRIIQFEGWNANPVSIMNEFLSQPGTDVFVKLDNDTIVPPGWFEAGRRVVESHPELSLLGIEPPLSRTPAPWAKGVRQAAPELAMVGGPGYAACDAIGGIGFMRRSAFAGRAPMRPHSGYGGFQDWQRANPGVVRGWIVPPLRVFLLDRLPVEPWASLSKSYLAKGWQRPWTNYDPADAELWSWWTNSQ